jgi:hypothetical protein
MSKRSNDPSISIQKNGRISWNKGTQHALGNPEFVDVLLDRLEKRLGVRRSERTETAYTVRKSATQDSWGVSADGPLKAAGIVVSRSHRRYAAVDGEIVYIDLTELMSEQSPAQAG